MPLNGSRQPLRSQYACSERPCDGGRAENRFAFPPLRMSALTTESLAFPHQGGLKRGDFVRRIVGGLIQIVVVAHDVTLRR
jgi:hypothetical protein